MKSRILWTAAYLSITLSAAPAMPCIAGDDPYRRGTFGPVRPASAPRPPWSIRVTPGASVLMMRAVNGTRGVVAASMKGLGKIAAGGKAVGSLIIRRAARAGATVRARGGSALALGGSLLRTGRNNWGGSADGGDSLDFRPPEERGQESVRVDVNFASATYDALLRLADNDRMRLPEALRSAILLSDYLKTAERSGATISVGRRGVEKQIMFTAGSKTEEDQRGPAAAEETLATGGGGRGNVFRTIPGA
jgi:hypothetical protein